MDTVTIDGNFSSLPLHKDDVAYIYRLYLGGTCTYVGQSVALRSRVYQHLADGKEFDRVVFDECLASESNEKEAKAIVESQPIENRTLPKNKSYVSVASLRKVIAKRVENALGMYGIEFAGASVRPGVNHKYISKKSADHALNEIEESVIRFLSSSKAEGE